MILMPAPYHLYLGDLFHCILYVAMLISSHLLSLQYTHFPWGKSQAGLIQSGSI